VRVGKIINRYCVAKHFLLWITDNILSYERPRETIEAEAHLDGMYVIRTSVCAEVLDDSETVKGYKSLPQIEQAFRCYKTIDLKLRPIYHRARPTGDDRTCFDVCWLMANSLQQRAFDLLGVSLTSSVMYPARVLIPIPPQMGVCLEV
jgi:hypothetical protein